MSAIAVPAPASGLDLIALITGALGRRPGAAPWFDRWWHRLGQVGSCSHPVRLRGATHLVDGAGRWRAVLRSADEADGVLLKACGDRRTAHCPGCAHTYQGDAYQLVAAGLRGGKGVPATATTHPRLFVTLTAPSFGAVHTQRRDPSGAVRPCHARRDGGVCPHGRPRSCPVRHGDEDPRLGAPLCRDCYDVDGQVLWNALATELWRRTTVYLPRALATATGLAPKALNARVRVSFLKVAEFQTRGVVHFHAILRLDATPSKDDPDAVLPPPARFTAAALEQALRDVTATAYVPVPPLLGRPAGERARWGTQVDVHEITTGGELSEDQVAGYIAKYATKSTESLAGPQRRLRSDADLDQVHYRTPAHIAALVDAAWRLGDNPDLASLQLHRWAHMLGFRGHFATKSSRYSTTFTALRAERRAWTTRHTAEHPGPAEADADGSTLVVGAWHYTGRGYHNPAEAALAAHLAAKQRRQRQLDRDAQPLDP